MTSYDLETALISRVLFLLFQAPPSVAAARLWSGWPLVKQRTIGQPSSWTAQLEKVSRVIRNAHYILPVSFVEKRSVVCFA